MACERRPCEDLRVGAGGDQVAVEAFARGGDDAADRGACRRRAAAPGRRAGRRARRAGWPAARGRRARRGPRRARRARASRARGARSRRRPARPGSGRWRSAVRASTSTSPGGVPAASASAISPAAQAASSRSLREAARGDPPAGAADRDQRASGGAARCARCSTRRRSGSRRASGSCARARPARGAGSARRRRGCCAARRERKR